MSSKSNLEKHIDEVLQKKSLTIYRLSKEVKVSDSALYGMIKGRSKFSEKFIKKIVDYLEIQREEFDSWILADKYPKELLEIAIKEKKEFPYKRKSILTTKIDEILHEKYMSRTSLAKQINYGQSSLNKMIMGKRGFSKSVLEKTATVLEISQDRLLSWIIADKYSLSLLEKAYSCLVE